MPTAFRTPAASAMDCVAIDFVKSYDHTQGDDARGRAADSLVAALVAPRYRLSSSSFQSESGERVWPFDCCDLVRERDLVVLRPSPTCRKAASVEALAHPVHENV